MNLQKLISVPAMLGVFALLSQPLSCNAATLTGDTSRPTISTFAQGENIALSFQAEGLESKAAGLKLLLDFDDEHDVVREHREIPVTPDSSGAWSAQVPAPNKTLGFYRVYAKLSDGTILAAEGSRAAGYLTYAVVIDPALRKLYPQNVSRFTMSAQYGLQTAIQPYLGIRWEQGVFNWSNMEPNHAGQFAENLVKARAENRPYPDLSNTHGVVYDGKPWVVYDYPNLYNVPKWALAPATPVGQKEVMLPEAEPAWTDYCKNIALANRALHPDETKLLYQITWEPDFPWGFSGTPDQLVRIYKLAYKAIHDADPNALVFGPTMGGLGGGDTKFVETLFQHGLAPYIDGFSVHPYYSISPSPEQRGMPQEVRSLEEIVRRYKGKDVPFVGTEQGSPASGDPSKDLAQARGLCRENLIMLGEGFWFNTPFCTNDFGSQPGYGYYYSLAMKDGYAPAKLSPKPVAAEYAAQSYLLDGSTSAGAIEWLGQTTLGYAFERDGQVTLAVWDYGDKPRRAMIPIGADSATVYDWMGNGHAATAKDGSLALTLGPEPTYIVGASPRIWGLHASKRLHLDGSTATAFPGDVLRVGVTADSQAASKALAVKMTPDALLGTSQTAEFTDSDKRHLTFNLPIPKDCVPGNYTVSCTLTSGGQMLAVNGLRFSVRPAATIEGVAPSLSTQHKGLLVSVKNASGAALTANLSLHLPGLSESGLSRPVDLAAGERRVVSFDCDALDIKPATVYQAQVRLAVSGAEPVNRTFPVDFLVAPRLSPSPVIDGNLDDWKSVSPTVLEGRSAVIRSPQYYDGKLSARVYYAWNEEALYLAVDVTDAHFVQDYTDSSIWKGDALQLGFDVDKDRKVAATGNTLLDQAQSHRIEELSFALTSKGPIAYREMSYDTDKLPIGPLSQQSLPLAIVHVDGRILYEAALPWSTLGCSEPPKVGDHIGVAMTVNSMSDSKQLDPTALGLFGGITPGKDSSQYGSLVLGP